jgi:predicted DNA-binding transcriptional regulator YafY
MDICIQDNLSQTVQDTLQFRWWLLSFGQHLVIQEPQSLVSWIKENAVGMYKNYGSLQQTDNR